MRKKVCIVIFMLLVSSIGTASRAAEDSDILVGMTNKMKRGVINTFTGWAEFPIQIWKGYNEGFRGNSERRIFGATMGVFDGFTHAVGRTMSGISDLIFYWAVNPEDNIDVGIPLDAEYAWQEGEPHDSFEPNITEGTLRPMVNKLFRGSGNAIFGFMELPNQITKGIKEKSADRGIIKGIWYWASREACGISDILSAPFPNPEDTMGVAFDDEWPWEAFAEHIEENVELSK